jgi:hypothetical protein
MLVQIVLFIPALNVPVAASVTVLPLFCHTTGAIVSFAIINPVHELVCIDALPWVDAMRTFIPLCTNQIPFIVPVFHGTLNVTVYIPLIGACRYPELFNNDEEFVE